MAFFRDKIQSQPETLNEFERAAEARYWDGLQLLTAGHALAGIYLMGYAAEMWLKYAFFRFQGVGLDMPVPALLGPLKKAPDLPVEPAESFHSLRFWAVFLDQRRQRAGTPLAAHLASALLLCVDRIHQNWTVPMRYRTETIADAEVETVHAAIIWLRDNRVALWRL